MDNKYINNDVYATVAKNNKTTFGTVESVMKFVSKTMQETIVTDNPKVSIKLDYLGNLYSNPERRKIIAIRKEERDGRLAINS